MRIRLRHERLARALAVRELSQNAWALRLGLDSGHLSKLLSGKRPYPGPVTRGKLLEGTGLAFDELFELQTAPRGRRAPAVPLRRAPGREGDLGFWNDARYTLRLMWKNPGFTALAILVIGLGVGATSAIFGVVDAVLLDPIPFPEPDRLVLVRSRDRTAGSEGSFSFPDFRDLRGQGTSFEEMAAFEEDSFILAQGGVAERVMGELATPGYFSTLGVGPALGRGFEASEAEPPLSPPVVVLSHGMFESRFGADPAILGALIEINDTSFTVVGVLPPGFRGFRGRADLFVPMAAFDLMNPELVVYRILEHRGTRWHSVVARLEPGVSLEAAEGELETLARSLAATYPESNENRGVALRPAYDEIVGEYESSIFLLGGAVGFLLLLTCANLANLFLGRVLSRGGEVAVRVAMGATRARLARQILTETVLFALAGGALGVLVARFTLVLLVALAPVDLPQYIVAGFDGRVFAFTLALAVAIGLVFGLLPALATRREPLKETQRSGFGRRPAQSWLALSEIALSTLLLVAAGLVGKSFYRMHLFEPGFEPRNLLTMRFHLPAASSTAESLDRVLQRVCALPGVVEAALSSHVYFGSGYMSGPLTVEGFVPRSAAEQIRSYRHFVTPGYFEAMGIPLLQGRRLDERDRSDAPGVVLVNESFAEAMWPDEDPVGKRLVLGGEKREDKPWLSVVGVVADVSPGLRFAKSDRLPQVYLPVHQGGEWSRNVVLRTATDPTAIVPSLGPALRELDAGIAIFSISPMEELIARSRATSRYVSYLMGAFAALSLLLAAVGLYGVVSFSVSRSTHEFGVRVALGAERLSVLALVLKRALLVVGLGLGTGLAASLGLAGALGSLLYEVDPWDRGIYAAAVVTMTLVVAAASLVPAARAASVDPVEALRHE